MTVRIDTSHAGRGGPLTVLVVDDDEDATELLRLGLERRGFRVSVARTCKDAIDCVQAGAIDALVSDIDLPDGSGYEIVAAFPSLPSIALTGFGRDEDKQRSREAGFDEHLTKPVRLAPIVEAIERIARKRRSG